MQKVILMSGTPDYIEYLCPCGMSHALELNPPLRAKKCICGRRVVVSREERLDLYRRQHSPSPEP
jgi:hypothetical protein